MLTGRLEQHPSREKCGTDKQWGASRLDLPTRAQVPPLNPQTILPSAPREFTNRGIIVLRLYCTCSIQKLVHTLCDYCKCSPVIICVCYPYKSVKMVLVIESLETAWPQIYYSMMNGWFAVTTWWQLNNCLMTIWQKLDDQLREFGKSLTTQWCWW